MEKLFANSEDPNETLHLHCLPITLWREGVCVGGGGGGGSNNLKMG